MEIINEKILAYAEKFSSAEDPVLKAINSETYASHDNAHMLSGHPQGLFLQMMSSLLRPRRILEIGTFTGYSALALAAGLTEDGLLHTLDINPDDAQIARQNFTRLPQGSKIILHLGNALEIVPSLNEQWDMVFIDADKTGYIDYYELVIPRLNKGGVILADNVLFHGEVLQDPLTGKNAKAIHAFNQFVLNDNSVDKMMLTIRDGLLFIIKK